MQWHNEQVILTVPEILSETYAAEEIQAREAQVKEISLCLRPITEGRKPVNCWLHGKPGAGKTATARWSLKKLKDEAGIRGIYVNCWENPTFFSVLDCIARALRMLGAEKLSTSFKIEYSAVINSDTLENPVAVEQTVVENRYLRIGLRPRSG